MPRMKSGSTALETARERLAGLKSINPKPNFGPALDIDQYEQEIEAHEAKLDEYNGVLSTADRLANELDASEKRLRGMNRRFLAAIEGNYGTNSNEYMLTGGTRPDDYKPNPKKKQGGGTNNT